MSPHIPFKVLFEDNHLLVVDKPALLPTMGVAQGSDSLVSTAKQYLKAKYNKPGNVYLGIVSRLDAVVSGVLVLARTSKAADRLNRQFQQRTVVKEYAAIVTGTSPLSAAVFTDWVRKNEQRRAMEICRQFDKDAVLAQLELRPHRTRGVFQSVGITLLTGRKHQIRLQLAARQHPIIGDKKYGSTAKFSNGIALHALTLGFRHPISQQPMQFTAPFPASWHRYGDLTESLLTP